MIKTLDAVLPVTDYYSRILGVEVGSTPIATGTHASRMLSTRHFDWLTKKIMLHSSTLVRAGLGTEQGERGDYLSMLVPFYPQTSCVFTESGGYMRPAAKAVLWGPQARMTDFQRSRGLVPERRDEWQVVREYFAADFERMGLDSQWVPNILHVAGLEDYYGALGFGDIDLHMDAWDCLTVAQAREGQLLERCYSIQSAVLTAGTVGRADSLLRTYEPLTPFLFVYGPVEGDASDPQCLVDMLAETIDLTARGVVLSVPYDKACSWQHWQFLLRFHELLGSNGSMLRLRLLPSTLALTTAKGVPVPISPRMAVSHFGAQAFFDIPLRVISGRRSELSSRELWEQQSADSRGDRTLLELVTEELSELD